MRGRGVARLGLVLIAVVMMAVGCGRRNGREVSGGSVSDGASVAAQTGDATRLEPVGAVSVEAASAPSAAEATEFGGSLAAASVDSLPPDLVVSITDLSVRPGEIIEITADGSSDVVEITLSDGIRTTQPLVYDSAATLWRIFYRVPMGTTANRIGLSLTAKNAHNRWRRVWVFPKIQRQEAQPDSTSGS